MIHLDISRTQLLPNGLRFSPDEGVLLAERRRLKIDPANPRTDISESDLQELRADIDDWRQDKHGLLQSGIMEPLKCRWLPGTLGKDGNPTKDSRLLIWDGGRRFRILGDYDWLPISLDDLDSRKARDAAIRTGLFNKTHSPVEQGHAFAEKMKTENKSFRAVADEFNVGKSVIENRVKLVTQCSKELQKFVADHRDKDLMSHALAMRNIKDKGQLGELMNLALHGASVREIEETIAKDKEHQEAVKDAYTPPTAHDQARQSIAAQSGSAPVSRGYLLTTTTKSDVDEAQEEIDALALAITDNLNRLARTRLAWKTKGVDLAPDHRYEIVQALRANGLP